MTAQRDRSGERGFSLVGLLVFFSIVMVFGIGSVQFRVSAMKGQEQQAAKLAEKRRARSGANVVAASMRNQLPQQYVADLTAARLRAGTVVLPAFDGTTVSPAESRPLMSVNPTTGTLDQTGTAASAATSLLGQPDVWATRRSRIAKDYAAQKGFGSDVVNVVSIRDEFRRPTGGSEDSYVLSYIIDGKADQYRTRPRGEILLGPNTLQCGTSVSADAQPPSIVRGTTSSINVTYSRAKQLRLTNSAGTVLQQMSVSEEFGTRNASFIVTPVSTETYRVEAIGGGTCSAISGAVTVEVTDPPCPVINQFAADPPSIEAGGQSRVYWNVSNGAEVRINGQVVAALGEMWVSPSSTTDYVLTTSAFGGFCPQTATARVTVNPCPAIEYFEAVPPTITRGDDSSVRWNVLNAGPGVVVTLDGVQVPAMGTFTYTQPASTQTHTLRVTGPGVCPATQQTVQITVNNRPCPQITKFEPNISAVELGNDVFISWDIADFTSTTTATLEFNGTSQQVGASGTLQFTMNAKGTFNGRLSVSSSLPECSTPQVANLSVTVNDPPPSSCPGISNVQASASCVVPGTPVTITWDRSGPNNGVAVQINGSGNYLNTNSATFTVTEPTTFTVTGSRAGCPTSSQAVFVDVAQPAPRILSYDPTSTNPAYNTPVTVSWNITGAVSGDINGTPISLPANSMTFTPSGPTDLVLTTRSGGCNPQSVQQTIHIEPQTCPQPRIDSFSPNPPSVLPGGSSNLSWAVANLEAGATVRLTGPGVDRMVGAFDSASVTPPASPGQYPYTITAVNPCNPGFAVQQTVLVTVVPCPPPNVVSFTATPNPVTAGATLRLQWQVDDPSGSGVTVSISPGVGGGLPASGFVDIPAPASDTNYILTAVNGCGASNTAQTPVTVTARPLRHKSAGYCGFHFVGPTSPSWRYGYIVDIFETSDPGVIRVAYSSRQDFNPKGLFLNGLSLAFSTGVNGHAPVTLSLGAGLRQINGNGSTPNTLVDYGFDVVGDYTGAFDDFGNSVNVGLNSGSTDPRLNYASRFLTLTEGGTTSITCNNE
jgi:hypothetical protein